jgi:TRAP-type C4-dicarboxylate transport system permease small subunit
VEHPILIFTLAVSGVVAAALLRVHLARTARLETTFKVLGFVEVGVLAALLAALVVFGCLQIVLRNFFHRGIIWADPLMRHIVLWIGCLGGALATSKMRHISIDVFTRLLPRRARRVRDRVVYFATFLAALVLGLATLKLVADERAFGEKAFLGIDTWVLQAILPAAFILMAYRSLVNAMRPPEVKPIEWDRPAGEGEPAAGEGT